MKQMHVMAIGQPFKALQGFTLNREGCQFEALSNGDFMIVIMMQDITEAEALILRQTKIKVKVIEEIGYVLPIIRFGAANLFFELVFDPTIYKDNRMDNLLKTNMVSVVGVDSRTGIIKSLRHANMPMALYKLLLTSWEQAKTTPDFSRKFKAWVMDLDQRYPLLDLWERARYVGKMGD
jgi:hypothetical protein